MEKSVLKKRCKGWLALMLAITLTVGSSMTVLAREIDMGTTDGSAYEGQILQGGDTIKYVSVIIEYLRIDGVDCNGTQGLNYSCVYTLPGDRSVSYRIGEVIVENQKKILTITSFPTPEAPSEEAPSQKAPSEEAPSPEALSEEAPSQKAPEHTHDFQWVTTIEPTETSNGLSEHRCSCGSVDGSQPISAATASVNNIVSSIRNAKDGETIVLEQDKIFCYTAYMMSELGKKQNASLKTIFTDKDGVKKSFTIPSGNVPADGEMFYGFTYLGNLYGWEEVEQ